MQRLPEIVGLSKVTTTSFTRTRLIGIAFILLGLLSLSLIITVIVQSQKTVKNGETNENKFCLSQGCLSASTHQLYSMNLNGSSNLCTDFYSYACGGWEKTHPIQSFDVERTILGDIVNRRDRDIQRLLDAPVSRPSPESWEYKLKTYYSECIDDYGRVLDSGKYMIALIQDNATIGGWFLFDNSAPNASQEFLLYNQTLYQQMSHIHGDLGVLAVFGIRVKFDEMDSNIKRLEFYPAGLSMEVKDYLGNDPISQGRRAAYQLYIIEVARLLARDAGVNDGNLEDRTLTIANDVFTVEEFLAESIERSNRAPRSTMISLINMSAEFSFDFIELMKHELGDPTVVTPITGVYLPNILYFTDAFEYFNNIDNPLFARMVHNYLRWRLIWTYIDDLSYDYIHTHRVFLDAYYGSTLHSTNEEFCTHEVVRRFPLAVQRLYTMNSTRYSNAVATVKNIVDLLKDGLKQYLKDHATWMVDETTRNIAREKADKLTSDIGYATIASDDTLLDNYYEKFEVGIDSHFQNAYNYHRFHRWSLSYSLANPTLLEHWDLFETRTSRLFDYIALFNRLFVIASGLHEPLVNPEWPEAVNMGSIGVLLAQKIFSSIDIPEGRTHLPNGTQFDWWEPPTINAHNKSRNCISDYYKNELKSVTYYVSNVPVQVNLLGEPFSPMTLRHIGALRLAYETFMKSGVDKSFLMTGTNLTSEQTFFLSYAQTQCFQRDGFLQILRTQLGSYDEKIALNAALIHMPEFTKAFNCKSRENQCFD